MKPTIADVQGLWSGVKSATSRALKHLAAKPTDTKRVALFQSLPVVFPIAGSVFPQKREVTWVNPAGDAHFTEVGHQSFYEYRFSGHTYTAPLMDSEAGLITLFNGGEALPFFDFEWNFKYGRNGAQYGIESALGGTDGFLSRKDFGNPARAQMLGWSPDDPLTLLAGDSITWTILPTFLPPPDTYGGTSSITVNLFMSGFRTGTPAEADYELR